MIRVFFFIPDPRSRIQGSGLFPVPRVRNGVLGVQCTVHTWASDEVSGGLNLTDGLHERVPHYNRDVSARVALRPGDTTIYWLNNLLIDWADFLLFFWEPKTNKICQFRQHFLNLSRKTVPLSLFTGTVLRDKFLKCWRKLTYLGLNKGRGRFLNFSEPLLIFSWYKTSSFR